MGKMEYWKDGEMEYLAFIIISPLFQFSIIPI